ncbi:MAG TPA: redoxin domain-containing protein [Candidatus Sulfotelmatobacter sp.]|nr:redoxin domain-containing protein [Candidatus Sulfotelmatobacter sp.]
MICRFRSFHLNYSIPVLLIFTVFALIAVKNALAQDEEEHHGPPPLAIGAQAPDFCLKGVDSQTHCLKDYASSKILVIAFICNHCPTSQLYETRIKQIAADYKDRGVVLVAIEPNNPNAVRLDEMGYTDIGDSFEEMQIRAKYRDFNFPYLYDGEDQKISNLYGPSATPHIFIFDSDRKLRYEGRVDNNPRENLVTRKDARLALDALLSGRPVELAKTPAVGCSTKWIYKEEGRREEMAEIEKKPVTIKSVSLDDLKNLHKNTTGKMLLVDFWATWCGPCRTELPAFETMYRMYGHRAFDLVTVSINYPDEKPGVEKVLQTEHATSTNLILGSTDLYAQLAAFDPEWNAAVPYTLLIRRDGTIAYKVQGSTVDALKLKRLIIANLEDDDYIGHQAYWKEKVEEKK